MQPINGISKTDLIALAGLFLVALSAYGQNAFLSQVVALMLIAFVGLALATGDWIIVLFSSYAATWFAWIYSSASAGAIPIEAGTQALETLALITAGLVLYFIVRKGTTPTDTYKDAICVLALFFAILGLMRWGFFDGHPAATLGNRNFLAAFLAVSAPCFYRRRWWLGLPIIIGCLIACHTATAIAAFVISAGWFLWGWRGALLAAVPGALYFSVFKAPQTFFYRLDYWTDSISKLSNSWHQILFGVGPGVLWQSGNMLHSEYVYTLWYFGLFGLGIAALYTFRSFRTIGDRAIFASFLAILIDGAGNHIMHTAPTAYLAIVIMALKDRTLEA